MPRIVLATLATFAALLPPNGLFHSVLAAGFFNRELHALAPALRPMQEAKVPPLLLLDGMIAAGLVLLLAREGRPRPSQGAWVGALVNLLPASAWNLANAASFVSWSVPATLLDLAWHASLGAAAGAVAALALGWRTSRVAAA